MLLACAVAVALGCSSGSGGQAPASGGGGAVATLANTVRLDGVTYQRGAYGQTNTVPVGAVERGRPPVGRVRGQVASYDLADGQATELEPGSPLYAVRGYDPSFRLAARLDGGGWALYEVLSNPGADSAAELLDVRGKVERVGLEVFGTAEEKAAVEEVSSALGAGESGGIVRAAFGAPLEPVSGAYFNRMLVFHLEDGTRSIRAYEPRSGELYLSETPGASGSYTGVVLPEEYRRLLRPAPPPG